MAGAGGSRSVADSDRRERKNNRVVEVTPEGAAKVYRYGRLVSRINNFSADHQPAESSR